MERPRCLCALCAGPSRLVSARSPMSLPSQGESGPHFVPRTLRPRKRFVQGELASNILRRQLDPSLLHASLQRCQCAAAPPPAASRQRDVRAIGPQLADDTARAGSCGDPLLQRQKLSRRFHPGPEDTGADKETQTHDPRRNLRRPNRCQSFRNARGSLRGCFPKELQRNVALCGPRPAHIFPCGWSQALMHPVQRGGHFAFHGHSNEKTHDEPRIAPAGLCPAPDICP